MLDSDARKLRSQKAGRASADKLSDGDRLKKMKKASLAAAKQRYERAGLSLSQAIGRNARIVQTLRLLNGEHMQNDDREVAVDFLKLHGHGPTLQQGEFALRLVAEMVGLTRQRVHAIFAAYRRKYPLIQQNGKNET